MRFGKCRGEESTRTVAGGEMGNDAAASSGVESVGLSGGVLTALERSLAADASLCDVLPVLMTLFW